VSGLAGGAAGPPAAGWRRWPLRLGLGILLLFTVGADFLASAHPLLLRWQGQLDLLPNLVEPVRLRSLRSGELREQLGQGDWAVFAPCPFGPYEKSGRPLEPPSATHLLGTDDTGRDVLARLIHGTRFSLLLGLAVVAMWVALGTLLGALAGSLGGWADRLVLYVISVLSSFPTLFLLLVLRALVPGSTVLVMAVGIALLRWLEVARLVRAEVLRQRESEHVLAARALGLGPVRILLGHILPLCREALVVAATLGVAEVILIETGLSFLGFGAPPPTASWGEILAEAYHNGLKWWLTIFPGLALFLTVATINAAGERLRSRGQAR
jgi:peptide/nickel transport system permease protein